MKPLYMLDNYLQKFHEILIGWVEYVWPVL